MLSASYKENIVDSVLSLKSSADAIVMLTWSNWFTELRSNRYHYAVRFARIMPVIFVQVDLETQEFQVEPTEVPNLVVLHLFKGYGKKQTELFNKALLQLGVRKPVFWVYNCRMYEILRNHYSVLNIYHATEDYIASDSRIKFKDDILVNALFETLSLCQLVIAVSDGVKEGLQANLHVNARIVSALNGCDYRFYSPEYNKNYSSDRQLLKKVAFYQGNIYDKLDYDLLISLAEEMPDWTFLFCGKVLFNEMGWQNLLQFKNVLYLGLLTPEGIREQAYKSTVGIIPFVQSEWLIERSFPLKTFEYLAAGLPVVTIPITALTGFSDVLLFAKNKEEFIKKMELASDLRFDIEHTKLRLLTASKQDYDKRFDSVVSEINLEINKAPEVQRKLKIGVLFEPSSIFVNTIKDHLDSFQFYSCHNVNYIPATQGLECPVDLNCFDVIVIHYSIRLSVFSGNLTLSLDFTHKLKLFGGYKIVFIQDEYQGTENAKRWLDDLGIHLVYTCVPNRYREIIYPSSKFPHIEFIQTLTGYIPIVRNVYRQYKKTSDRPILIGYRGRELPFWYGSLGYEKLIIGVKTKEYCLKHSLNVDIEWGESKRIYGSDWYNFLSSCRATLGTESGSNLFDNGNIRAEIQRRLAENPNLQYTDIHDELIAPNEIIEMNQISPKLFESIYFKTALILFEGSYSGILLPNIHFIPLKKDFSNIEEVIKKVQDNNFIDSITERAYQDIIGSGIYSYKAFIQEFDSLIKDRLSKKTSILESTLTFESQFFNSYMQTQTPVVTSQPVDDFQVVMSFNKNLLLKVLLLRLRRKCISSIKLFLPKPMKVLIKSILLAYQAR